MTYICIYIKAFTSLYALYDIYYNQQNQYYFSCMHFLWIASVRTVGASAYYLPQTKNFDCVGRGDLTSLFFSKVAK